MWNYTAGPETASNFILTKKIFARQRIKNYEENNVSVKKHMLAVLLKREQELAGIDPESGEILWTVNPDTEESRYYQTIRHPHHNIYGKGIAVEGDTVYCELAGHLTAIRLRAGGPGVLIWKKSLGEYTTFIDPVIYGDKLFAGLINARGELWYSCFGKKDGSIIWNTYLGLSSFLSPASGLCITGSGRIIAGTNHGVYFCIDAESGGLSWIRKYKQNDCCTYSSNENTLFLRQICYSQSCCNSRCSNVY